MLLRNAFGIKRCALNIHGGSKQLTELNFDRDDDSWAQSANARVTSGFI
jgi:hypothetical protein